MGARIDNSINDGRGPPLFKICGQVHHRVGSLLPLDDSAPQFLQLYVYDTANEVSNRLKCLDADHRPVESLDPSIVHDLISMLDQHNPFAKKFRMTRDQLADHNNEDFIIRIVGAKEGDPVQYNLPTTDELAMLVVGDFSLDTYKRDIIIETHNRELKRISSLHPAYMPLQYPLLFPYGERGFQLGIHYSNRNPIGATTGRHMTMQEYYCYQFHYRKNQPNPYLCYGLLSSQAKVDARAAIEESRLHYIAQNQRNLRMESIQGIADAVSRGCINGDEMGKRVVLPASHVGGRRYMIQNYHDGLAICGKYGPPDFFVTFTCNPSWPEITESIFQHGQTAPDRSDVVTRVFHLKLHELLQDIRSGTIFGPLLAVYILNKPIMYSIHVQKMLSVPYSTPGSLNAERSKLIYLYRFHLFFIIALMPNKPLSALTLQDRNAEVQIQIHRKWEFRGAVDNGPILHIDMILTDCTGNAIHCQIPSFLAATRGDEFQVGKIYKMTRFSVARAKSTYKPVDGDLMLYVTPYTTLELCHTSQSCFPLYVYHLTSYDKIDPDGSNARNFHGEVLLSGGATCHWYFNPSIEEAEAFYSRIESEKINIELPSLDKQEITPPSFPQREHHNLKYILSLNPHDVPDQGYECTVTITCIPEGKTWYYIACNTCPNKPSTDPVIRQCSTCRSTNYCFRYKLTFKASDGTEEAEMFAFDNVARTIIGKPCPTVVASFPDASAIPPEIAAIVSRKYTFIIEFNSQSFRFLEKNIAHQRNCSIIWKNDITTNSTRKR
ncbi:Retrotransposon-like protein [Zea mays]|nr:Retrotransposon-like protein [Zea mays]